MQALRLGQGRASGVLSNIATTSSRAEELITQLQGNLDIKDRENTEKLNALTLSIEEQKQKNILLAEENERLKADLNDTKQTLTQQINDSISKNDALDNKLTEQEGKLDLVQENEKKSLDGINKLLLYVVKTNFEQCDIISNIQTLTNSEITPEIQNRVTVDLQKQVVQEAVEFFDSDRVVFNSALTGIEPLLGGEIPVVNDNSEM